MKSEMANQQKDATPNSVKTLRFSAGPVLALILLFGMILRVSYLHEIVKGPTFSHPQIDAAYHDFWARGICTAVWTVPEDLNDPDLRSSPYFRPPGYPFLLAVIYYLSDCSYLGARIFQMGLGLLNCVLAYLLGKALFGRATGLIFAAFMSMDSTLIYFEGELLAPVLLVTLALILIYAILIWYDKFTALAAIAVGIFLGLFAWVRPNVLIFVPVILGWFWWTGFRRNRGRSRLLSILGFLLGCVMVIAPATIRNYLVAHDFVVITSNLGINLYIGNNEKSDGVSPVVPILRDIADIDDWTSFDYPIIVRGVGLLNGTKMKYSEVSSYFTKKAVDYILENPTRILRLLAIKTALFWGPLEVSNNKEVHYEKLNSRTLRHLPGFPFAISFAILGIIQIFSGRKGQDEAGIGAPPVNRRQFAISVLVLLFIITYFVSYLPFFVAERFRSLILPFLFLFGAYGLYRLGRKAVSRDFYGFFFFGIICIGMYLAASRPLTSYKPSLAKWHFSRGIAYNRAEEFGPAIKEFRQVIWLKPNHWEAHNGLGLALLSQGKIADAIRHCSEALRINPDCVEAHINLGNALKKQGKISESISCYTEALRIDPDCGKAHINLGVVLAERGRTMEAIPHFYEALRIRPEHAEAHNNLGLALLSQGNFTEAIRHCSEALRINPDYVEAHNNLGIALARQGRLKEAMKHFSEALRIKPDIAGARRNLERGLRLMGQSNRQTNTIKSP
jgi:tetratricopeptide (TPR) repeat protein